MNRTFALGGPRTTALLGALLLLSAPVQAQISTEPAVSPEASSTTVSADASQTAPEPAEVEISSAASADLSVPRIRIVYPREGARIAAVSNSFVYGSVVPASATLTINGSSIAVYRTGSFIAYLPFSNGSFKLRAKAWLGEVSTEAVRSVVVGASEDGGRPKPSLAESVSVVEVSTDEAILRTGPSIGSDTMGYEFFLPRGVRMKATGTLGNETRIKLADSLVGWTDTKALKTLPEGTPSPRAILESIRTQPRERGAAMVLELREKVPYRVWVSDDLKTLTLTLYSTIADIDRLRYTEDSESPLIGMVRWIQTSAETVEVRCPLKERLWGYDVRYENGRLICEVYAPPKTTWMRPLSGLTVAVDPGHSPNLGDGTIGPQGVKEGDANFQIAAVLKDRLERSGAKVFMTRRQDEAVPLPERGRRAAQAKADLFVSVHTNALPDGANPFDRGGYSVFYFQPQSYAFAREVHAAYKESIALADDGFYYGNLAVCRTTQMPSILTESGYLILPQEEELLLDPVFQRRIADSIVHGLSVFMRSVAKD